MLTVGEWIDVTHEIANDLEHRASMELGKEVAEAQAKHKGYTQACEDFARAMREKISQNQD